MVEVEESRGEAKGCSSWNGTQQLKEEAELGVFLVENESKPPRDHFLLQQHYSDPNVNEQSAFCENF